MASSNILSIDKLAVRDDTIIKKEIYPYAPYTTSFGEADEIRIAIQSQDSYLLPCESYLWMQISATTTGEHQDYVAAQEHNRARPADDVIFFVSYLFDVKATIVSKAAMRQPVARELP